MIPPPPHSTRPPPGPDDLVFCSPATPGVPLLDRLGPARAAGFAAISLMPSDIWGLEAQGMTATEIAARIADAGLVVAEVDCTACWMERQKTQGDDSELWRLLRSLTPERVLDSAVAVGASSVVAVALGDDTPPFDEAVEGFARLCDLAADRGLKAQIEFLPSGGIRTLAETAAIAAAAGRDNGGITLDSWHFTRSGGTLEELAAIPGHRIHTVQLNDGPAQPQGDPWEELMTARRLPGEGEFDLIGIIRTLDAIGSTAPLGVEVFNTRQNDQSIDEIARNWAHSARAIIAKARGNA